MPRAGPDRRTTADSIWSSRGLTPDNTRRYEPIVPTAWRGLLLSASSLGALYRGRYKSEARETGGRIVTGIYRAVQGYHTLRKAGSADLCSRHADLPACLCWHDVYLSSPHLSATSGHILLHRLFSPFFTSYHVSLTSFFTL